MSLILSLFTSKILVWPNGLEVGGRHIQFDIPGYIERLISEIDIDKNNAARVFTKDSRSRVTAIKTWQLNTTVSLGAWRKADGELEITNTTETAQAVLEIAQRRPARPYRKADYDAGQFPIDEWTLRPLKPLEHTLEELKLALAEHGYTLGYNRSFVATEQTGPAFYLLDKEGNVMASLGVDYTLRESVENAWIYFQEIKDDL